MKAEITVKFEVELENDSRDGNMSLDEIANNVGGALALTGKQGTSATRETIVKSISCKYLESFECEVY